MARGVHSAPKKKAVNKRIVAAVLLVAVLLIGGCCYMHFSDRGTVNEGQEITIEIPDGTASRDIGTILRDGHVIKSANEFNDRVKELGMTDSLKAGTYRFVGGQDIDSIIDTIASGVTGVELMVTPGTTAKEISEQVESACGIKADTFYALTLAADDYVKDYPFLEGVYNNSMEGFLYPDTYMVPYDADADDVICLMLDNFASKLTQVDMAYAQSKNLTVYDVVTLASMVEKESANSADKPLVASVFYNRLHEGMNLGSDVTTYYAVGKKLTEELTAADLASDSPYNTRNADVKGLPAGPICSVSLETLTAAANPTETSYLYFFYSNKEGKTMFFEKSEDFDAAWKQYGD